MKYIILTLLLSTNTYYALEDYHISIFTSGFLVAFIIANLIHDYTQKP